jgi:hypothetical protein
MKTLLPIPVLLSSLLAFASPVSAAGAVNELVLWSCKSGPYMDDLNPDKQNPKTFAFAGRRLARRTLRDAKYGERRVYVGLPLEKILFSYRRQAYDDTAILHFENGMRIPVPLTSDVLERLDAFVAVEACTGRGKGAACVAEFPEIAKEDVYGLQDDPRPITFTWNKLVVSTPWHPNVPVYGTGRFSPWRHADTLVGIEFVNSAAYWRQFDVGAAAGQQVFVSRCQFCHAVRYVGARFGWDFVTPLPLYEKRPPEQLLNHVKYPKAMARRMGLMMPTQPDVSLPEMQALWTWMRGVAKRPLRDYQP